MSKFLPEVLKAEEVQALIQACGDDRHRSPQRNRALIAVMYRCGLRCNEAVCLNLSDFDSHQKCIRVHNGKGGKARVVGIDQRAIDFVTKWLGKRGREPGVLFCTRSGKKLDTRYVRRMVARIAKRAGIEKRVHPHCLRHTHASELAREGMPIPMISKQLGHANISTTHTYLNHIDPHEMVTRINQREWS